MSLELSRQPLRVAVRDELIQRVYRGELRPGERLNETHLADDLGVSRTPLREALLELTFLGVLSTAKNRGFFVRELTVSEAGELYRLCGHLEGLALEASPAITPEEVSRLEELDERRLSSATDPIESVGYDNEWHSTLIDRSGNEVLLETLRFVKGRLYRYEYAYAVDVDRVESAVDQHSEILEALEDGRCGDACDLLESHWSQGDRVVSEMAGELDVIISET